MAVGVPKSKPCPNTGQHGSHRWTADANGNDNRRSFGWGVESHFCPGVKEESN